MGGPSGFHHDDFGADSAWSGTPEKARFPNPDPDNFTVKSATQVGDYVVAEVDYPDATNYEGSKVMVLDGVTVEELALTSHLDPHFDPNSLVKARVRPDADGRYHAELFARLLAAIDADIDERARCSELEDLLAVRVDATSDQDFSQVRFLQPFEPPHYVVGEQARRWGELIRQIAPIDDSFMNLPVGNVLANYTTSVSPAAQLGRTGLSVFGLTARHGAPADRLVVTRQSGASDLLLEATPLVIIGDDQARSPLLFDRHDKEAWVQQVDDCLEFLANGLLVDYTTPVSSIEIPL